MLPPSRLTKDRWASFNGKAQWDCQVALRGPDIQGSETIKMFTTAVIRQEMAEVMRTGGTRNAYWRVIILPERFVDPLGGPRGASFAIDWSHFLSHIEVAAHYLNIPVVKVPAAIWFPAMKTDWTKALRTFFPILPAGEEKNQIKSWLALTGFPIPGDE